MIDGSLHSRAGRAPGATRPSVSQADALALLDACAWPSEAFWRIFELAILKGRDPMEPPVLEIGCGDGAFTELAGFRVDEAIDLNPRAVARARLRTNVYGAVEQRDLRNFAAERPDAFHTIFANSVLEHVPGLEAALPLCLRMLKPGGTLVATVPLSDLNDHLLIQRGVYARFRARQLAHHNLWALDEWERQLNLTGFVRIAAERYLDPANCRFWDQLDFAAPLGFSRYRLAPIARRLADFALPDATYSALKRRIASTLYERYTCAPERPRDGCAALISAHKPEGHAVASS